MGSVDKIFLNKFNNAREEGKKLPPAEQKQRVMEAISIYMRHAGGMPIDAVMFIALMFGGTKGLAWIREAVPFKNRFDEYERIKNLKVPRETLRVWKKDLLGPVFTSMRTSSKKTA